MPRSTVTFCSGSRACVLVALSLTGLAAGCGRLGFETPNDGGLDDAFVRDAFVRDAFVEDAFARDAFAVDAAFDAGCGPALDLCFEIPRLEAAPTIDGVREACVPLVPIAPVGWTETDPVPAAVAMRAAVAWRPDGLYVFVEVDDPDRYPAVLPDETYCGDGVEIYVDDDGTFAVDGAYDDPGTVQLIGTAPATDTSTVSRGQQFVYQALTGVWPSARYAMVPTPTGYAIETLVSASELGLSDWTLAVGQRIGFALSLNVSTTDGGPSTGPSNCGARLGQFFSRVVTADPPMMLCGQPFCDSRAFCTPVLR